MSSDESDKECPLCLERFEPDDITFYPCTCHYQICRFCWHRIRTDENGLCPACRQPYPENPVNFQPLSVSDIQKIKAEKRQRLHQQKNKLSDTRQHLSIYRVLQKNLVYVVGLSSRMADPELLKKSEFFGKFGRIIKIAVGTASGANSSQPSTTHTAYVTYGRTEDALRAIQAVNNATVDGRQVKASLGTTKYCSNFLKGQTCHKPECMYLHEVADESLSFTKDDMQRGKHTELERKLHDQMKKVPGTARSRARQNSEMDRPPPGFQRQDSLVTATSSPHTTLNGSCENNHSNGHNGRVQHLLDDESVYGPIQMAEASTHPPMAASLPNGVGMPGVDEELRDKIFTASNSKVVMTCDELERMLLSSPPPGFEQFPQTQVTPISGLNQENYATTTTTTSSGELSSAVNSSRDFFNDLYDDIGFDPFSESSKALADMLAEEKSNGHVM